MTYPLVSLIISLVFDYSVLALIDGLQQQLRHQHQLVQEKDSESYRNFINSLNSNMTRKTATMATGRRCTGRGCQPVSDFTQCDQRVLSLPVLWAKLVAHQLVGLSAEERGDRPGPAVEPHVGDLPGFVQAVHTRELPGVTVHRGVKHHHVCLAEPADDAKRRGSRYLPDRLENDTHQLAAGSGGRQDRGVERYVGRESGKAGRFDAEATGRPGGDVGHRQVDVVAEPLIRDGQMVADQLHERPGPGVKVDGRIGALRALGEGEEQTNLAPWPVQTNVTKARSSSLAVNSCSRILRDSAISRRTAAASSSPRSGTW